MKHIISFLIMSIITLTGLLSQTFEIGGINYNITSATTPYTVSVIAKSPKYAGSVTIPETVTYESNTYTVTSIGAYAFDACFDLTNISLPNTITTIGHQAFYGCTGLNSITIPNSVTTIAAKSFLGCINISSVQISQYVLFIGEEAFSSCLRLETINVDSNNPNYASIDGVLYNKAITRLIQCPGAKVSVTIPNTVTVIGESAFHYCNYLTSVTIPASVTFIGEEVFAYCDSLLELIVDSNNTNYSALDGILYNKNQTVLIQCPQGKISVNIPGTVLTVGRRAFWSCSSLLNLSIPNSVKTIETLAFFKCDGLTQVNIPASVTTISERAFASCRGLLSINVAYDNPTYSSHNGILFDKNFNTLIQFPGGLTTFETDKNITTIANWSFWLSTNLTSIKIPNSVNNIGNYAFSDCYSLSAITCFANIPPVMGTGVFNLVPKTIPLNVPCSESEVYRTSNQWGEFNNIIGSEINSIPEPDNAGNISGITLICNEQNGVIYSVEPINNSVSYLWTLPEGASGSSNSNNIVVSFSNLAISGLITVKGKNLCGISGDPSIISITVKKTPENAGSINGISVVCQGQESVAYTVSDIDNATDYIWSLPPGATGTSNSNNISIDFGTNAISGNITVKGRNSCGDGVEAVLTVDVNEKPETPVITIEGNVLQSNALAGNQWYNQNGLIDGAISQDYALIASGDYFVVVTISGCASDPSNTINYIHTKKDETLANNKVVIYPNPFSAEFKIYSDNNTELIQYEIFDTFGSLITKGTVASGTTISEDHLSSGVYIIRIKDNNSYSEHKLIKRK